MNKTFAIQFKAAFMLFIFSLNMFVGFACSIGINTSENILHHQIEATENNAHAQSHKHGNMEKGHQHGKIETHNHKSAHKNATDKKGCCNDEVQKVQQLDKNINSNAKVIANDIIADDFQTHYQLFSVIFTKVNPAKLRERFFYPPPPNILLNIQRFQI